MLSKVDKRIAALATKIAGDKLDIVLIRAEEFIADGKQPARALADSLESFKLIKNRPVNFED